MGLSLASSKLFAGAAKVCARCGALEGYVNDGRQENRLADDRMLFKWPLLRSISR